jgi:hypothetical protein
MSTETLRELQAHLKVVYETTPFDKDYRNELLGDIEDELVLIRKYDQALSMASDDMTGQDLDSFYGN